MTINLVGKFQHIEGQFMRIYQISASGMSVRVHLQYHLTLYSVVKAIRGVNR